jgi:hypothetical protein
MPDPRKAKRARCEAAGAFQIEGFGARLNSSTSADLGHDQAAAHRAVREMLANGARFKILRREGREDSFIYELPDGGDRERCRAVVQDAKERGGAYWRAFFGSIRAYAGGPR